MPFPIAAAIAAGTSIIGDIFNNSAAKKRNDQQRQWALEDWNRQNEYNSPAAQMQRYKEAGLSPNLIYGQTNTAAPVRSTDTIAPPQPQPAKALEAYLNTKQQQLTTDNLAKQLEVQQANIDLIKANTTKANSETDWKNVNTQNLKENIMPFQWDYMIERSRQQRQVTANLGLQNEQMQEAIKKVKSDVRLNATKQEQIQQIIKNYVASEKLLGEKFKTEENQNKFVQQIDGVSKIGGLGLKLIQMITRR